MSTQISLEMVDFDPAVAAFVTALIEAKAKIKEWETRADEYEQIIKAALGEASVGLVNGREAVRWTAVETSRIDTKKVQELLPKELVDRFRTTTQSKRFTVVTD
jgi:predicted phage-related endonuclease